MAEWNFAEVWEVVADQIPDADAIVQGQRRIQWRDFDRRADGVATALLEAGARRQDKIALYLYNSPEYLEASYAAFKVGLVPVNTNYRYVEAELVYLWDNADAVAVVFHGSFAPRIVGLRDRVPRIVTWLWVDDDSGPCPKWATPYEEAAATPTGSEGAVAPWGRSGDDLLLMYTGGTTGRPKGVMWRQHDLFRAMNRTAARRYPDHADLDEVRAQVDSPGPVSLPTCPLMHGTGGFSSLGNLSIGGQVVLLEGRALDPVEILDTIERERVEGCAIVGDAFAKPLLRALDAEPDRWDLSSLRLLGSSGAMWSEPVKAALLAHHDQMLLADAFASTEALGMGRSVSSVDGTTTTARFVLGADARVINDDGSDVTPGSGERGRMAVKGPMPLGYYKDDAKTQATFITLDDERFSIPGDWATVDTDGTINLLGRGSVCINTGGEKVFPEEVEEVLKLHPAVQDAVAVGVPDDKFGEAVTAIVQPTPGATIDAEGLIDHTKAQLARYKAPKRVVVVDTIGRAPNGKVDYQRLRRLAIETLEL